MSNELVVKTKKITLVEMTPQEAIEEMEALCHESFIFLNSETKNTCMIYTRNDGQYGLLETE